MLNDFYVYIYLDPRKPGKVIYGDFEFEYEPFYVGKGQKNRDTSHLKEIFSKKRNKNWKKINKIKKIIAENKSPIILHLKDNLTENEAWVLEKEVIQKIGKLCDNLGPLTNLQDGGTGGMQPDEVRKLTGLKISQRWKEGRYIEKINTPVSDASKEKNRKAHLGKKQSEETIRKKSEAMKGHSYSEETKQKMREAVDPVQRSNQVKESWQNPETARRRSESLKKTFALKEKIEKTWVHKEFEEKQIEKILYQNFINEGWSPGRVPLGKGMWINDGNVSKMFKEDKAVILLAQGWAKGRLPLKRN